MQFILSFVTLLAAVLCIAAAPIDKRITHEGDLTWYDAGLGACGWENSNSDFVAALSVERFGSGGNCGQYITITAETGAQVTVQAVDECEGCGEYDLDLSPAAFEQLYPLSVGRAYGATWNFQPWGYTP